MKILVFAVLAFVTLAQASRDWSKIKQKHIQVIPKIPAPKPRIVGGTEPDPHGLPYQVAVIGDDGAFCGGSIIREDVVLTAAHCVDSASTAEVIAGAHYIKEEEPSQQIRQSRKIILHEEWDRFGRSNDIALIILSEKLNLDDTAQIVKLNEESSSLVDELALVSGWGVTADSSNSISPVLLYAADNIISNTKCNYYYGIITDNHVCLNGKNGGSACRGDSGGALVVARDNKPVQVGVLTFGSGLGCEFVYPTAYTRVSKYISWINNNLP